MTACFIDSGLEHGIFLNSDISQGSVVTELRCGGIVNKGFVANLLVNLSVKEFWKSVNIWRSYGQYYSDLFFIDSQCSGVSHRSQTASGSGRRRADLSRLFSSKRRFRMNAEQRSLNLSNLRVFFHEYPREIAVIRSFISAQNAANIVQRPGSRLDHLGKLTALPQTP